AAANHQQALELFRDLGARQGEAEALNNLGQLATRTSATQQARGHHVQALAIARDLGVPLEQARALEGIGDSHLQDGNPAEAASHLWQALAIYQRIGALAAQRVQQALHDHKLTSTTPQPQPAAPTAKAIRRAAVKGRVQPEARQNSVICAASLGRHRAIANVYNGGSRS